MVLIVGKHEQRFGQYYTLDYFFKSVLGPQRNQASQCNVSRCRLRLKEKMTTSAPIRMIHNNL
jgi:hypothetical protein